MAVFFDSGQHFHWSNFAVPGSKFASYAQIELTINSPRAKEVGLHNGLSYSFWLRNLHSETSPSCFSQSSLERIALDPVVNETNDVPGSGHLMSNDDSNTRNAVIIREILKSHENNFQLETALSQCVLSVNEDLVVQVLQRHRSNWKSALSFFNWACTQTGYSHGSRAYNEMLDILGRMKQITLMRQVFDNIPKEKGVSVISDDTFAILMNRYAGGHKVQEAIDIFYKRKDYGFELDLVGFQTLLVSLCRFKHVEEAEALFLQKQNEFPPVIKSRNIILNGWCVMGVHMKQKGFGMI